MDWCLDQRIAASFRCLFPLCFFRLVGSIETNLVSRSPQSYLGPLYMTNVLQMDGTLFPISSESVLERRKDRSVHTAGAHSPHAESRNVYGAQEVGP